MKIIFLSLALLLATFLAIQPIIMTTGQIANQRPITIDPSVLVRDNPTKYVMDSQGMVYDKGKYIVTLKNETFNSIFNDPKFKNPKQFTPSNIPSENAKMNPALRHEYIMEITQAVGEKVKEYNKTKLHGGHIDDVFIYAFQGFTVENVENITAFVNDPDIESVNPSRVFYQQAQYYPNGITRSELHKAITSTLRPDSVEDFSNVDVAVIDSGVVPDHPDLNVFRTINYFDTNPFYAAGHGTHVAGIIGARDNLGGVVGVVPGARIWSLQACGSTAACSESAILSAMNFVAANTASIEVVNMSVGPSCGWLCNNGQLGSTSAEISAVNSMVNGGVTTVVAAGNSRVNTDDISFCDVPAAVCVSALADYDGLCGGKIPANTRTMGGFQYTDKDDTLAWFSNFGSVVDLMAPGTDILSTWTGASSGALHDFIIQRAPYIGFSIHGGYGFSTGTSMSAPFVSGAAALVKILNPSFTPAQILSSLQTNALAQNQACDGASRGGLIEGANARSSEKILNLKNY